MLGYMTRRQAVENGFTHNASYCGIPIWIKDISSGCPTIATKFYPLEFLLPAMMWLEQTFAGFMFPDEEPAFMFVIRGEI